MTCARLLLLLGTIAVAIGADRAFTFDSKLALYKTQQRSTTNKLYWETKLRPDVTKTFSNAISSCLSKPNGRSYSSIGLLFTINADGAVVDVEVDRPSAVALCVSNHFQKTIFAAPPTAPFYFPVLSAPEFH